MGDEITKKQREKYTSLRDDFSKKRKEIGGSIRQHQTEIKNLEKELENSTPDVIEGCSTILKCEPCGIYSMKPIGVQIGEGERLHWHECVVCYHRAYYT